ncbi:MAG: hypothetical protein AB2417_19855 [Clostridiaceae bacterium]
MKYFKYLIVFIGIFSIFIAGCSNRIDNEGNKIIVQKSLEEDNKYEQHKEIIDDEAVQKVKDILHSISWENAKVNMAHPSDYKFYFVDKNEQSQSNKLIYDLWISPNNDKVELVIDSESKYVQLDKNKSAKLFEILTGGKLSDLK